MSSEDIKKWLDERFRASTERWRESKVDQNRLRGSHNERRSHGLKKRHAEKLRRNRGDAA